MPDSRWVSAAADSPTVVHQLAYVTQDRLVAWKCLSLDTADPGSSRGPAPIAYASRSGAFFNEFFRRPEPLQFAEGEAAVLWVVTIPRWRRGGDAGWEFPATLVARLVVDRLYHGAQVRKWAKRSRADALSPPKTAPATERWRTARAISCERNRAAFRIARGFAMEAWNESRKRRRHRSPKPISEHEAWSRVRVVVADPNRSRFFGSIDASRVISKILGPYRGRLSTRTQRDRRQVLAQRLQTPKAFGGESISALEELAATAKEKSVFLSYRWKPSADKVREIAAKLVSDRFSIWLDRIAMPDFDVERERKGSSPTAPDRSDLEDLLFAGIREASLFLALVDQNYTAPRSDDSDARNWAHQEYKRAITEFRRRGRPDVRVVNLGQVPDDLDRPPDDAWEYAKVRHHMAAKVTSTLAGRS